MKRNNINKHPASRGRPPTGFQSRGGPGEWTFLILFPRLQIELAPRPPGLLFGLPVKRHWAEAVDEIYDPSGRDRMDLACTGIINGSPGRYEHAYRKKIPDKIRFMMDDIAMPEFPECMALGHNMNCRKWEADVNVLRKDDLCPQDPESFFTAIIENTRMKLTERLE